MTTLDQDDPNLCNNCVVRKQEKDFFILLKDTRTFSSHLIIIQEF